MRHLVPLLLLSVAIATPHSLPAQYASAAVGVRLPTNTVRPSPVTSSLAATPRENYSVSRVVMGAVIGAATGALVTVLVVHQCEVHDTSHGDGPPCGIGYVAMGPLAVVIGAALGAVVADITQ